MRVLLTEALAPYVKFGLAPKWALLALVSDNAKVYETYAEQLLREQARKLSYHVPFPRKPLGWTVHLHAVNLYTEYENVKEYGDPAKRRGTDKCAYTVVRGDDLFELCRKAGASKAHAKRLLDEVVHLNGDRNPKQFWIPGRGVILPRVLCLELLKQETN